MILRIIINTVATKRNILRLKCTNIDFGWGFTSYPAGGSLTALPRPIAGLKGSILREGDRMEGKGRKGRRKEVAKVGYRVGCERVCDVRRYQR